MKNQKPVYTKKNCDFSLFIVHFLIIHCLFFTLQAVLLPCSGTRSLVFAAANVELIAHGKVDVAHRFRLVYRLAHRSVIRNNAVFIGFEQVGDVERD